MTLRLRIGRRPGRGGRRAGVFGVDHVLALLPLAVPALDNQIKSSVHARHRRASARWSASNVPTSGTTTGTTTGRRRPRPSGTDGSPGTAAATGGAAAGRAGRRSSCRRAPTASCALGRHGRGDGPAVRLRLRAAQAREATSRDRPRRPPLLTTGSADRFRPVARLRGRTEGAPTATRSSWRSPRPR